MQEAGEVNSHYFKCFRLNYLSAANIQNLIFLNPERKYAFFIVYFTKVDVIESIHKFINLIEYFSMNNIYIFNGQLHLTQISGEYC